MARKGGCCERVAVVAVMSGPRSYNMIGTWKFRNNPRLSLLRDNFDRR